MRADHQAPRQPTCWHLCKRKVAPTKQWQVYPYPYPYHGLPLLRVHFHALPHAPPCCPRRCPAWPRLADQTQARQRPGARGAVRLHASRENARGLSRGQSTRTGHCAVDANQWLDLAIRMPPRPKAVLYRQVLLPCLPYLPARKLGGSAEDAVTGECCACFWYGLRDDGLASLAWYLNASPRQDVWRPAHGPAPAPFRMRSRQQ